MEWNKLRYFVAKPALLEEILVNLLLFVKPAFGPFHCPLPSLPVLSSV